MKSRSGPKERSLLMKCHWCQILSVKKRLHVYIQIYIHVYVSMRFYLSMYAFASVFICMSKIAENQEFTTPVLTTRLLPESLLCVSTLSPTFRCILEHCFKQNGRHQTTLRWYLNPSGPG